MLENGVGTRGRRDNERILVVVQVQEAYIGRKKWGRQRSPQCIYTYKQRVARTELATKHEMSTHDKTMRLVRRKIYYIKSSDVKENWT